MPPFNVNRREFLQFLGGGICVVSLLGADSTVDNEAGNHRLGTGERQPNKIGAWLPIDKEGKVWAYTGKVEVGKIRLSRLARYRVPRFQDTPEIETVLMDRKDVSPAGGGETPIIDIAPAVGNAIFHTTGKRRRALPMTPNGIPT